MKNIILYLFIFSLLINIFQYVDSNKILDAKEKELVHTKNSLKISRDSLNTLYGTNTNFDLKNNENAQEYFYNQNLDFNKVIEIVNNDINDLNANKNGNPLIPYDMVDGKPFLISRIKIVNHRWVIAEFSNGKLWGEVALKYFLNEGKPTDFETMDTVLFESTL
jgi:hypothetical protein